MSEPDYASTLKPSAVETPLDLWFFRPAAHVVVKWAHPRGITPNQLTLASIATGLIGAAMLASSDRKVRAIGGLFGLAYGVLDCADGQLARATGTSSRVGRILDGASDYIVGTATGVALRSSFGRRHGELGSALASAGLASIVWQGTMFDHAKNKYLSLTRSSYREGDDLEETRARIAEIKNENGPFWELALLEVYAAFLVVQSTISSKAEPPRELSAEETELLKAQLEPIARGFAWLGPSTHVALMTLFGALDAVELYVVLRLVLGNLAALVLSRRLSRVVKSL